MMDDTYLATNPREVLLFAFEITCISQCDQFLFVTESPAYPNIGLAEFLTAWDELVADKLLEETTRETKCRSHEDKPTRCKGWAFTNAGRDALTTLYERENDR